MSRNRIEIDRELERYLEDLKDEVYDCVDDQRNDAEDDIANLDLNEDNLIKCAASVLEVLYFDDKVSITKALKDAAQMTVNASIYATLERKRLLKYLPERLEEDLKDDFLDVSDMTESRNSRSRDSGRESRRDSRREAAGSARASRASSSRDTRDRDTRDRDRGREDRNDRGGNARDNQRRERQNEDSTRADERQRNRDNDKARDKVVDRAAENLDTFDAKVITKELIASNPVPFCAVNKTLALGPVYWLGAQVPVLVDGQVSYEKAGEEMEWEKHRTDLYLAVRKSIKPSTNVRDSAITQSLDARDRFVTETVEKLEANVNAVTEQTPVEIKQVFTSDQVLGKFYGNGTALLMIQSCLETAGLRYLPNHPTVMKVEHYPMWTMNTDLTAAVEDLLNVHSLNNLMPALIKVSNECDPVQWVYFHDKVTGLINQLLKVELDARPYLNSIITEWPDFAGWLETHANGSLVHWFNNNINVQLRRIFHVYKHGSDMQHSLVDGTSEKYASVSSTTNLIYVPVSSDNFGAASPTKLGRVLESVTPKLYKLLSLNVSTDCASNLLVTQSDEHIPVYSRESALINKVILMGECNWS